MTTYERVNKIERKEEAHFKDLQNGVWFQWSEGGTPCLKLPTDYVDLTGILWGANDADSDIVIPIKVHLQYEVL